MDITETPKKARKGQKGRDWSRLEIRAALIMNKISLRQLSIDAGYSPGTVKLALRNPYPAAQEIIAKALGMDPWDIWPSRYDATHSPIRRHGRPYPIRRDRG
ncbi:MAG: helix-turn-helix domain-containing protein [Magnetococcales bacterium]|nr:helix-turn-helix domain-containing protein [Magnetococcales bacterium]